MMTHVSDLHGNDVLFKSMFEHSAIGMALVGLDGRWLEVNSAICRIVGYEREELLATNFQAITHPEDVDSDLQHMKQLANGEITFFNLEKRYYHKKGHIVWILLTVSLIRDQDYTPRFVVSQIQDISARIKAEAGYKALLTENRMLIQNLFNLQEKERRYLAGELHDELGQWLTALYADARTISRSSDLGSKMRISADAMSECIKKMNEVIHGMLRQLRPAMLDTDGLANSLRDLIKQWCTHDSNTTCNFVLEGDIEDLGEVINITVYRIIQEALNNVHNHAHATIVLVRLSRETNVASANDVLLLSVKDDGKGYDPEQRCEGFGLLGMRERSIAAGGTFASCSIPGHGASINVQLPLEIRKEK